MSENPPPEEPEVPDVIVEEKTSRFSAIWLIPIVAALIGAFLVYRTLVDRGPIITIHFEAAEGLEAGKTKIRYKDVEIGVVNAIELAEDLSKVIVTAELVKSADAYLTDRTRFWVVRAEVSAGRVSQLGTLLSGVYIGIDPSTEGAPQREFEGLSDAPIVTSEDLGRLFTLRSTQGGSFDAGAPVLYRKIQVGEIVSSKLDDAGENVDVEVFVRAPHDERVRSNTRFWNASGIDVTVDAEGLRVDTESLTSILIGGIAFDTPATLEPGQEAPKDHVFPLHANRAEANERKYSLTQRFQLNLEQSVDGLHAGAPVVFQGIPVGQVLDVKLQLDRETLEFTVPVLIEIEPQRVGSPSSDTAEDVEVPADPNAAMGALVVAGLRARLKTGNLITGQKVIELVMQKDAAPAELVLGGRYPILPTIPTPFDELTSNVAKIVERVGKLPIEAIGKNLDQSLQRLAATLQSVETLTGRLDEEVVPNLAAVSRDASELLKPSSTVTTEVRQLLVQLNGAVQSLGLLADYLERHPEALIRGKEDEN